PPNPRGLHVRGEAHTAVRDADARPHPGAGDQLATGADVRALADDGVADDAARAGGGARRDEGTFDGGPGADLRAVAHDGLVQADARAEFGAAAHDGAAVQQGTTADGGGVVDQGLAVAALQQRRRGDAADQVRGAAHEVGRGAHVTPVRVVDVAVDAAAVVQERRENLALDADGAAGGDVLDDLAAEHVAAGVDLVGRRVLGFLQEFEDAVVVVRRHA